MLLLLSPQYLMPLTGLPRTSVNGTFRLIHEIPSSWLTRTVTRARCIAALLKTHRQHTEFVYSRGARGAALERVCEVCRKKVHLGWDDRYYIGVGGARPEVHEFCLRPKPSAG